MPESELFGQLLVRLGVVRAADVARALELQRQDGRRLGEVLVDLGLVGRAELETALLVALGLAGSERAAGPPRLGEVLVGLKYLDRAALDDAVAAAGAARRPLGEHLIDRQLCSHAQVYEALALQARGPAAPEPPAIRGARIVVVDDSPVIRELLVESLVALGHAAHAVGDPFDALAQIVESPPALVVTDLDMPGLDGLELCRRLKAGPARKVPVILLTASDGDVERVRGLRAGADDYVSKSASLDELGARIASLLRRTSETERVRQLFARYTSPAVVEEILRRPELVLTGEQRECTILFADLRDFTALAEALPAVEVVELLNEVLGRMAEAVLACDGTLDKMLGDGIMAVFGAPVGRDNDALRAVHAAEMMVAAVAGRPVGSRQHRLAIGVGVNTGTVVAGNLGSAIRTDYTVIGDAVNVASRLCSLARAGEILIGERTQDLLAGAVPCEALAPVRLKGKAQPVPVARVARALARAAQR